jgi:hypothetical protein
MRVQQTTSEEVWPHFRRPVAGESDAASFVALANDVIEVFGSRGMQQVETKVIVDQEVGPNVDLGASFPGTVCSPTVDPLWYPFGFAQAGL